MPPDPPSMLGPLAEGVDVRLPAPSLKKKSGNPPGINIISSMCSKQILLLNSLFVLKLSDDLDKEKSKSECMKSKNNAIETATVKDVHPSNSLQGHTSNSTQGHTGGVQTEDLLGLGGVGGGGVGRYNNNRQNIQHSSNPLGFGPGT